MFIFGQHFLGAFLDKGKLKVHFLESESTITMFKHNHDLFHEATKV